MPYSIPFTKPVLGGEEIEEVVSTLKSGWITTGHKTKEFEKNLKNYVGSKYCSALSSCTAALHLSLDILGIGEGDEVITSPFTFVATANTIMHTKAKPVFADIDPITYNISPEKIQEKITDKTKAIMPVHYAGHPCDMEKIMKIAKKNSLFVIEDAAHAIGSEYKGKKIGKIGDITCFSFYANKVITTIEGGALLTDRREIFEKARTRSLHGMDKNAWKRYSESGNWYYEVTYPGYKYNMTDVQASVGIHQLKKLDAFIEKRKKIAKLYNSLFKSNSNIIIPHDEAKIKHSWYLYPIQVNSKIGRDGLIKGLKKMDIGTSVSFIPVHLHPFYKKRFGFKVGDFPVTESVFKRIVSLPMYSDMKEQDAERVASAVNKLLGE